MEDILDKLAQQQHYRWSLIVRSLLNLCEADDNGNYILPATVVQKIQTDMFCDYNKLPLAEKATHQNSAKAIIETLNLTVNS